MSLERRLREGLERSASVIDPVVERRLPEAITRGRRHQRVRRAGLVLASAITLVGIGVAAPHVTSFIHRIERPAASPGPTLTPGPYRAIAGTYTSTLRATSEVARTNAMAGAWTLRLEANGVILLSAPSSFKGVPSAIAFNIHGDRFTTNAFVNDPRCSNDVGVYRWELSDGNLTFAPITEACALRRALFSSEPWHASP